MTDTDNNKRKKQQPNSVVVICVVALLTVIAGTLLWINHINNLRNEMESHFANAVTNIEQGEYEKAQANAGDALALAHRLHDNDEIIMIEAHIKLTATIILGNDLFNAGNFRAAHEIYTSAAGLAADIPALDTLLLSEKIAATELYIAFYILIEQAERAAKISDYTEAISIYEEAKQIASALSFPDGIYLAESGIEEMHQLIKAAKRIEAANLFLQGEQFYNNEQYTQALIYYKNALTIFVELEDHQNMIVTQARVDYSEQKIAEMKIQEPPATSDTQDDTHDITQDDTDGQSEEQSNYEHNSTIDFDMQTLIDNQHQRPANQIRMGSTEGMNEGWYNGCGWVATYNALILLGDPRHPAEIVRFFEESNGTVMGGVFGTYPNTIERYIRSLGFSVDHTLFPQLSMNIDDAIKASRVSILAYAHTSAAHYVAIEYREDIDKFIVYNDRFTRAMSANLGLESYTNAGAAIDSVSALISNTREILFSFSLIVIT